MKKIYKPFIAGSLVFIMSISDVTSFKVCAEEYNTSFDLAHDEEDYTLTNEELELFRNEFYNSLQEDNIDLSALQEKARGAKSKAAKIAAKKMLKKLISMGKKPFEKAVNKAISKLPGKVGKKVAKYVTYEKVKTVLNFAVNLEGDITDAIEKGLRKIGVPKAVSGPCARIIVFILF